MKTLLLCLPLLLLAGCHGADHAGGVTDGKLAPCPQSPNCVSSQDPDPKHRLDPIPFTGDAAAAKQRLLTVIRAQPRAAIKEDSGNYLHAVFTSRLFRFRDDVEFVIDPQAKVIHFRSASRLGYSDLGVNKKRMENIRAAFTASP